MNQETRWEARNDSHIHVLMNMGLTFLEATVYLTLVQLERSEIPRIARASSVARPEVYRVMPLLLKLGLAEKIIDKKTLYEATPIKEGLSLLLQNKKEQYAELEEEARTFVNDFHSSFVKGFQAETQGFKITSEKRLFKKTRQRLFQSAQTSIDVVVPRTLTENEFYDGFWRKEVKIRFATQEVGKKLQARKLEALAKNLGIEFKFVTREVEFGMHIFDKKEVTMCLCEPDGLPSLWSNNSTIVRLAETYFEHLWNS